MFRIDLPLPFLPAAFGNKAVVAKNKQKIVLYYIIHHIISICVCVRVCVSACTCVTEGHRK